MKTVSRYHAGDNVDTMQNTMIFPEAYKTVGMSHTDMTIAEVMALDPTDESIYFLSEFVLVDAADGYVLYRVSHTGDGLMRNVSDDEVIAWGSQIYHYPDEVNLHDRTLLIRLAERVCKKSAEDDCGSDDSNDDNNSGDNEYDTVVFTGYDRHVTFIHKPDPSAIRMVDVVDVVPPHPSGLSHTVSKLADAGLTGELQMDFDLEHNVIDLSRFEGDNVVFPCTASGLSGKCLDSDTICEKSVLVGCEISNDLFSHLFPDVEYEHVSFCPFKSDLFTIRRPFLARCCQSANSGLTRINGHDGVIVHWGASMYDVAEALKKLAQKLNDDDKQEE